MFYQVIPQPHTIHQLSHSTYLPPYRTGRRSRSVSAAELARHGLMARTRQLLSTVGVVIGQHGEGKTAVSPTSPTEK